MGTGRKRAGNNPRCAPAFRNRGRIVHTCRGPRVRVENTMVAESRRCVEKTGRRAPQSRWLAGGLRMAAEKKASPFPHRQCRAARIRAMRASSFPPIEADLMPDKASNGHAHRLVGRLGHRNPPDSGRLWDEFQKRDSARARVCAAGALREGCGGAAIRRLAGRCGASRGGQCGAA